jgi:hypothetical protein
MISRALWLQARDENKKNKIHHFANHREQHNTIWSIHKNDGSMAISFEDISKEGSSHFEALFKADPNVNIGTIIRVVGIFPRFISPMENQKLMEEITLEELEKNIHAFQKEKILGPDGFPIDFYKGCFDIVGDELLKMIEHSRRTRKIHAPFNDTFISLILKVDDPTRFDQFRPISLCTGIYKIIAKIIAFRIKENLSENIFEEQFDFLRGRQFHQAIGIAHEGLHTIYT